MTRPILLVAVEVEYLEKQFGPAQRLQEKVRLIVAKKDGYLYSLEDRQVTGE